MTILSLAALPEPARAQYFGRNKVSYDDFSFKVLETPHFDIYYYEPEADRSVRDFASMAERWYERLARTFQHEFEGRKPIIVYRNQPDFQQTNAIPSFVSQATGGVTESVKDRVILPFAEGYGETDHVLGHELVHAFQYDIAQARRGGGATAIGRAPSWLVEGMAEYLSVGRQDAHTAMWMRDAVLRDSLPSIEDLSDTGEYFPYRYGQALWAYITGVWGDQTAANLYRDVARHGMNAAIRRTLGIEPDTLSAHWRTATRIYYQPLLQGRTRPEDVGHHLLEPSAGGGLNLAPVLDPDGKRLVVLSQQDPFSLDLSLVDPSSGELLGKLASSQRNPHFEALAFTNTSGSWSPDGRRFAFVTYESGDNQIAIANVAERKVVRTIPVRGVEAIFGLAWSPSGDRIALSGSRGGVDDLYLLDLTSDSVEALTNDRYTERQPAWSPDGSLLAFATDRGPGADLDHLSLRSTGIGIMDVATGEVKTVRYFDAKHVDPAFSPDGRSLYFLSDREGFSDLYRADLRTDDVFQITRAATGLSGLTAMSPAMSVAARSGDAVFTVFESGDYAVATLRPDELEGRRVSRGAAADKRAGFLPPAPAGGERDLVATYLSDPLTGLPADEDWPVTDYHPDLQLDYLAQPTAGIMINRFGTALGGSLAAYFSDMLGDHELGVGVIANGGVKDIGGEASYVDRGSRIDWGLRVGRVPYRTAFTRVVEADLDGTPTRAVDLVIDRTIVQRGAAMAQYPLSTTQRFEAEAGGTRISFDREIRRDFVRNGFLVAETEPGAEAPESLNLAHASVAFVRDNSQFGFTSPVVGQRMRFEVEGNTGSLDFTNLLADVRDYTFLDPVTFALRGLYYGRHGGDAEDARLSPLFLGQEQFVRGYSFGSFDGNECTEVPGRPQACPEFDRLVGSRLLVAGVELRVPLIGTDAFGLLHWGGLPTELALFTDAGAAWTSKETPTWRLTERSTERVPVVSSGASLRFNVLGRIVVEAYYAVPFQRPEKSGVWGIQLSPGW